MIMTRMAPEGRPLDERPLSDEQKALWAAHRAAPQDPGYTMAYAGPLRHGTDPAHVAAAFAHVIAGHEALSSTYGEDDDGIPVMRRLADFAPDVAIVTRTFADTDARAAWLAAQADLPLDLEVGVVCRVRVLVDGPDTHIVIAAHHIAGDFLALEQLTEQAFAAYGRLERGLAPEPVPTGRYWAWMDRQRATLAGDTGTRLTAFWRTLLADPPPDLDLPAGEGPPPRDGPRDDREVETDVTLDAATTAALRALAARLGIGLLPLLATIYHVFLGRWGGQDRFLVGTPVSGRMGAADRDLIGYTLNVLPWPVDLRGDPDFTSLARRTHRTFMGMLRHHRLPLNRIAAAIGRGGALFRHMTTLVPVGERRLMRRHISALQFATQRGAANDLNLRWVDWGPHLVLQWRQDTTRHSPQSVARMRRGFLALLDQVLAAPGARLSALRAHDPADEAACVGDTGTGDTNTALALFTRHAARTPTRVAVECGDDSLTYAALDAVAARLAGRLADAGVRPGDTVGLHLPRGLPLAVAMIAAWKAGAAYLCLDPALPAARLAFMAEDADVRLVLGQGAVAPGDLAQPWMDVDAPDTGSPCPPPPAITSLPAYVIFTSGSTGTPKGVVVTQGNLAAYVQGVLAALNLPTDATLATLAAVTADLGYTAWFGALLSGRTLRLIDGALADDPDALARHLAARPVDALKIVPSHLAALMAVPEPRRLLPRHSLILGGEALSADFVARIQSLAPHCRVINHYGPTETTVGCLTWETRGGADDGTDAAPVPVGRPLAGVRVAVLDRAGCPLPIGVPGELAVGGIGVADGYHGRPALTAGRFVPDPDTDGGRMYLTGDRVIMRGDGAVLFLGRADDQVKIRGFRVELGEVEARLRALPGVAEAAVVARPGPGASGLRLAAFIAGPAPLDPAALSRTLAAQVPDAMVPTTLTVLTALPRLPNGKIDRAALPEADAMTPALAATALSPMEAALAALWAAVLGRPAVNREDDFFAIGGDSILALQVIAKARPQGLPLTPKLLFQKRTLAAVAAALAALPAKASPKRQTAASDPIQDPPFALAGLDADGLVALRADRPDVVDAYPLSPLQQGLLFHSLLDAGSGAYVNQLVLDGTGPFTPDAFARAWQAAVDAHPLLRTGFLWEGLDAPLQLVHQAAALPVADHDWAGLDADGQEKALADFLAGDRAQGFALDAAPLMRLALIDRGDDRWWLVWSRHHLVVDGWCSILLLDEVLERYRAQLVGTAPVLARRRPFRDHIAWLARQDDSRALAFWDDFLVGVTDATPLPMLRPNQPGPAEPLSRTLTLDGAETARLIAAARNLGVTLNTLVQGAWGLTLAALSGREDVVFGVTSAGRPADLDGADAMLGVFINTLPLRLRVRADRPLGDYLRAVQADNLAMREHEHAPLAAIQKRLTRAGGAALFDTLLVFQNLPMLEGRRRRVGALDLRQRQNVERTHYGLTVEIFPGETLSVAIDADARRIDGSALERLAQGFHVTLLGMARGAATPLGGLPRLGTDEMELLRQWRATPADHALRPDWVALVAERVALHPDRPVARCDGSSLSYEELWQRSERLARGLVAAGVRPDGVVALLMPRGLDLLTMMVAVLRAGGAWLPLDPAHPPARWRQVTARASALLVRDPAIACDLPGLTPADLLADADAATLPAAPADGRQLAYVLFTSGSTGEPKGVMITRDGMLNNMLAKVAPLGLGETDIIAQTAPACFDINVWQTLTAPLLGATVEIIADAVVKDPDALLDRLADSGVTVFEPVPSLMRALVDGGARALPTLRWVLPTGEALTAADARAWFAAYPAIPLMNAYGPAECADDVAFHPLRAAPRAGTAIPIGRPTANADLRVLDADLSPVPVGTVGEIVVGGVGVGRGYSGDPRRTAAAFVPDPDGPSGARVYRTGDLGRWTADGLLEWVGRKDFQVKVRGFRIEPGEIEAVLEAHPAIRRAAVLARGDRLVAYWQAEAGAQASPEELERHVAARLPPYMVPAHWIAMAAWPLNANGKLDRSALPDPVADATEGGSPATETEQRLAALWRDLLPGARIGRDGDFFALGGHSLLAARLVARLRRLGWDGLALRTVFEAPTLRRLAAHLDANRREGGNDVAALPPLVPVPRGGPLPLPLSPAQQRLWLVDQLTGGDTAYSMAATLRLDGPLDAAALEAALNAVIARHEILRTAYPEEDGEAVAMPIPELTLALPLDDLSALPTAEREARALLIRETEMGRPFDLDRGPPLRARLIMLAPERHLLVFAMHHMVADGWSVAVLTRDLSTAYRAALAGGGPGGEPDWAPLPVQYADYAVWQRQVLSGDGLRSHLAFWRGHLAGAPTRLRLPTDRPRPPVARTTGGALRFQVPTDLLARLDAWARSRGATLFMALLAGFQALLHQVTGDDDLVVGTDTAGRPVPEVEDLIGFFVNVVPLRSRRHAGMTSADLLDQTRHTVLGAFDHDALPFDRIVEAVGVPRDRSRNPLVQALFVLQNVPEADLTLPDLTVTRLSALDRRSKFDLAVFLEPETDGMAADWVYAAALFDPDTIHGFHQTWIALLRRAVDAPDQPLAGPSPGPLPSAIPVPVLETSVMSQAQRLNAKLARLGAPRMESRARPVPSAGPDAVRPSFLPRADGFPVVLEPVADGLDALAWAAANRPLIDGLLARHAGILFRGFGLATAQTFEDFAEAMEPGGLFGGYGDLPKKEGGRNTYRSTPYPERQMILFHNESAHLDRWPRKQWFFAERVAPVGGCTPIVDCREMLRRLPPVIVTEMETRGLLYVRTFTPRLDVGWRDFFKTDDRDAVTARCAAGGIECRWLDPETPQTRSRSPAVIRHPLTGERSFFNQVQLHHPHCLEADVREDLLDLVGLDRFPRNVLYGDGTPIPDAIMEQIGQTYEACAVRFDWRGGDVVMVDNMLAAHARDPYEGPRRVVVAMGAMTERTSLTGATDTNTAEVA